MYYEIIESDSGWLSGLQEDIAGSCWVPHQPEPPSLSPQDCCQSILCPGVFVPGISLTSVRDLALLVLTYFSRLSRSLWMACVSSNMLTAELGAVGKLGEGVLSPTVNVADKDVKQRQSQYWPLRNNTCQSSLFGHWAIHCNSLNAATQPNPYWSGPPAKSMCLQFREKVVVWDSLKCFAQVQAEDLSVALPYLPKL